MTIGNSVKKFTRNLAVGGAISIVRGFLNEQMKNVDPSDLYEAVMENRDLWVVTPDKMKSTGRQFKGTLGHLFDKYQNEINTELLLKWLQEDHPDLFSTLINIPGNKGVIWYDLQVNKIKHRIIEM